MDEEKLHKQVLLACDKHELRGDQKEKIFSWVQDALLQYGLLKNIEMGFIEICGIKEEDGDVLFQLTEAGKTNVEKMIGE